MIYPKKTLTAIITVLLISTAAIASTIPLVQAVPTYCFLSANPNPVGKGQPVVVSGWIQPIPGSFFGGGFSGLVITITDSEGNEVYRWIDDQSDLLGGTYFTFTPTEVGEYTCFFTFAGDTIAGTVYEPSEVPEPTILVVQEDPIPEYQPTPVPNDYWTRPIPSTNREWTSISGNWLYEGYKPGTSFLDAARGFNPYSQAPRAPHIMWTKELTTGGLIGGDLGSKGYYPGLSYQAKLKPPLIINGRLYYNNEPGGSPGFTCVDLRTGEEIYRNTESTITLGQTYYYASGNQMGAHGAFLWSISGGGFFGGSSDWDVYDAFDGRHLATLTGAASGVYDWGPDGEVLVYYVSGGQFNKWNSTVAFQAAGWISSGFGSTEGSYNKPSGSYSWSSGVDMTVSGAGSPGNGIGVTNGVVVFASVGATVTVTGFNATTGARLYTTEPYALSATFSTRYAAGEGIFTAFDAAKRTWVGWNATTGEQIWESDPLEYPWGSYNSIPDLGYNTLYTIDYAGALTATNVTDGTTIWKAHSDEAGLETPYGRYPFYSGPIIASDVVFVGTGEHSPTQPLARGAGVYAFDAHTGDRLWKLEGWFILIAIADGYLISYNAIDNRIYCIGKGPSATEVSIETNPTNAGEPVAILGKVTDQSSALKDTPAIADVDMAEWMEYMIMQQSMPQDVVGVPVQVVITHPNGTQEVLDYAIGDMGGSFAARWVPPEEGIYQVTAYFPGTDAYGSSYATTHIIVDRAAEEYPEYPQYGSNEWPEYPQYTMMLVALMVAVVVAIVIGVINLWTLRRRK